MYPSSKILRLVVRTLAILHALVVATLMPSLARGQTPKVYFACYVPGSGTVYRIKEPNTPEKCAAPSHTEFSWTDGTGADHGALTGLADDDHKQYLLTNGVRAATNGFIVSVELTDRNSV